MMGPETLGEAIDRGRLTPERTLSLSPAECPRCHTEGGGVFVRSADGTDLVCPDCKGRGMIPEEAAP